MTTVGRKRPFDDIDMGIDIESVEVRRWTSAPASPRLRPRHTTSRENGSGISTPATRASVSSTTKVGTSTTQELRRFDPNASLVLVGIRGCGKRSLGFIAATALGRRFVTEDHYFRVVTGLSRQDFLKFHGSEEFHKQDVQVSRQMLEDNGQGCVIDCGLGSLTSGLQDYLKSYSRTHPVIHVLRDMEKIRSLLKLNDHSARLLENGDLSHRKCSNYEFFNLEDNSSQNDAENATADRSSPTYSFKLREVQADFSFFVKFVTGMGPEADRTKSVFSLHAPLESRLYTHALRIPLSAYEAGSLSLSDFEAGGDVTEILVDKWDHRRTKVLSKMTAELRRHLSTPMLLSIDRSASAVTVDTYLAIVKHGIRLGFEYVAVDMNLDVGSVLQIVAGRGTTRVIASFVGSHGSQKWHHETFRDRLRHASSLGIDMVKVTQPATTREDNDAVSQARILLRSATPSHPSLIAYNTGSLGRTSQVFNPVLTSVTHPSLKRHWGSTMVQEQPQVSAREATKALFASFVLDPLRFYVLGANVSTSLSPVMHNAAYSTVGLLHDYRAVNVRFWEDIQELARDPNFGGASIAQPWKVKLISKLENQSDHARGVGAVNTLIPVRAGVDGKPLSLVQQAAQRNRAGAIVAWYGDNTDWISIQNCIRRSLSPRNAIQPKTTALVVGAGGMARAACYALVQLGCQNIFIYNRTLSNANTLADHFNRGSPNPDASTVNTTTKVQVLESVDDSWPAQHAMPSIIISCVTHERLFEGSVDSDFTVPPHWLGSTTGGVAVEQAFYRQTPFVHQMTNFRASTDRPWVLVNGLEVLHEQGIAQFELMTGRKAPRTAMWNALCQAADSSQDYSNGPRLESASTSKPAAAGPSTYSAANAVKQN